jgi:hypothetical protein
MRRTLGILFISFSFSGLWGQLWQLVAGHSVHGRPVPTCGDTGGGNPDGAPV